MLTYACGAAHLWGAAALAHTVSSIPYEVSHFACLQPTEQLRRAQDTTVRRKPDGGDAAAEETDDPGSAAMAGRRTLDSLGAADSVVDAMDLASAETDRLAAAAAAGAGGAKAAAATPNPLMLGLSPAAYVLRAVQVRSVSSLLSTHHRVKPSPVLSPC